MSRSLTKIRDIGVDRIFGSTDLQALINKTMKEGKKTKAEKIVYGAMNILGDDALNLFEKALSNLTPDMEVRYRKVGGATCAVPRTPNKRRSRLLAMKWLLSSARKNVKHTMQKALADELLAASNNEGDAMAQKQQLQKLAESNRAYAGLNW